MADPVSVVSAAIVSGDLIIGLSDGGIINAGRVQGPQGLDGPIGPTGANGFAGHDGNTIRTSQGRPAADLGVEGDFAINTVDIEIFGPKLNNGWGNGTPLRGRVSEAGKEYKRDDERELFGMAPTGVSTSGLESLQVTAPLENIGTATNPNIYIPPATGTTTTFINQEGVSVTAGGQDGYMTAADKEKLDHIAPGADVTSVFGRDGEVTAQEGDYSLNQIGGVTITAPADGELLVYQGGEWVNDNVTPPALTILGSVDISQPVPPTYNGQPYVPSNGDMWVNTITGAADASWVGIAGETIAANTAVVYAPDNSWHVGGVIGMLADYVPLSGGDISADPSARGPREDGALKLHDDGGAIKLALYPGGNIDSYGNQLNLRGTNQNQTIRAYGNQTKALQFQIGDGTTFETYFEIKQLAAGDDSVTVYSVPLTLKSTGIGESGYVTQNSSGAITGSVTASTGDIFTTGQLGLKHNNDASPSIIAAWGGTGTNLSFRLGNSVNPVGLTEVLNITPSLATFTKDVYLEGTNLWFSDGGIYQYLKVPSPAGHTESRTLVMSCQKAEAGAVTNTQYWNADITKFEKADVEMNVSLTVSESITAGGGAEGWIGFGAGHSINYFQAGTEGAYTYFTDNISDGTRTFATLGWTESNFFRPVKIQRALSNSQTGSTGFDVLGVRPGYLNADHAILYTYYKTYSNVPANNTGDSIRYEGAIANSTDLVNKGYVDSQSSGNTYTIDHLSGINVATRNGELNFNNSDPALVTYISFAPNGDSGNPIHPIENTDLIGILVNDHAYVYQVTGGTANALNVLHVKGTAPFVSGDTAESRIFPSNFVQKTGALHQTVEGSLTVNGTISTILDHGAIGIKRPTDAELTWYVWHPDSEDTGKPVKYVGKYGCEHLFHCYDVNNENPEVRARFTHGQNYLNGLTTSDTLADQSSPNEQIVTKQYVDQKPPGTPFIWAATTKAGDQLLPGECTLNSDGTFIFAKTNATGGDIGISSGEVQVSGVKLQYTVYRQVSTGAWNTVIMGITESYFMGSGTNFFNRIQRSTNIVSGIGGFSEGDIAYVNLPGWL